MGFLKKLTMVSDSPATEVNDDEGDRDHLPFLSVIHLS